MPCQVITWFGQRLFVGLVAGLLACAGLAFGQNSPARDVRFQARVQDVVDGDTVHLQVLGGRELLKARLQGIDAPEICQAFGPQSRDALARRINQMMVTVESTRLDDYGRSLVVVYLNGENINAWLVQQGLAWSYGRSGSKGPYASEEAQARLQRRGLFSDDNAVRPAQFRRKHRGCT